jgi:hypothetical protein
VTTTTNEAGTSTTVDGGVVVVGGTQTLGLDDYVCGTVSTSNPTLSLSNLHDGDFYTIAVAAVDSAGNVGPLGVVCRQPQEVADFWANYIDAHGQAGGGYCSAAEGVGLPAGTSGLAFLTFASIVAIARKRRR